MNLLEQLGITPALLITQIVGFLILLWLLNRFMFKPIFGILDERRLSIQETYDQLDRDRAAMEQTRRQYEERLANIEHDARERIQAAVKEAQSLRDSLVSDAQRQAEAIIAQGRNESEQERQQAFLEMRQQVVALAVAAAGKVVGESLDDARHVKLVDDFIGQVGVGAVSGRRASGNGAAADGASGGKGAAAY